MIPLLKDIRMWLTLITVGIILIGGVANWFVNRLLDSAYGPLPAVGSMACLAASVLLLSGIVYQGIRNADRLLGSTATMTPYNDQASCRFLIMGYSPMREPHLTTAREQAFEEMRDHGIGHVALPQKAYAESCAGKGIALNQRGISANKWQQNARAINHHIDKLEAIYVLRPDDDEAEFSLFRDYVELAVGAGRLSIKQISRQREPDKAFQVYREATWLPPSYLSYSYVFEGIRRGLDMIAADFSDFDPKDGEGACVDATAGFKTFSIGAAIATLNANAIYSHVDNDGVPRFYDASVVLGQRA